MLRDMLQTYLSFHRETREVLPDGFESLIRNFSEEAEPSKKGGLIVRQKEQWQDYSLERYREFVARRHSVRDFAALPIDDARIHEVVEASMNTPSVCNRQGWKVHYYSDKKAIKNLLGYQNGNAGFTDCIDKLLIVTGNVKAFTRHEHNQLFIDGGLVSMNIMLALHAAGLGSCPLNTCMPFNKESTLKNAAGIPKHEKLIMMIAIGSLKEKFSVAQSEKYKLADVLKVH